MTKALEIGRARIRKKSPTASEDMIIVINRIINIFLNIVDRRALLGVRALS